MVANPSKVLKAKSEYADDKNAKSVVESVRSRLAWWQRRAKEHSVEASSDYSGTLTTLGVTVEESWIQVCRCILERGEESAHSVGVPVVRCFRFGIEGRQTIV